MILILASLVLGDIKNDIEYSKAKTQTYETQYAQAQKLKKPLVILVNQNDNYNKLKDKCLLVIAPKVPEFNITKGYIIILPQNDKLVIEGTYLNDVNIDVVLVKLNPPKLIEGNVNYLSLTLYLYKTAPTANVLLNKGHKCRHQQN